MPVCNETIEANFNSNTTFTTWKGNKGSAVNALPTTEITDATQLSQLATLEAEVYSTMGCLQEKLGTLTETPSAIQTAQTRILALQTEIQEKEKDLAIAKDRVGYIRDPDAHPSYYQGWFAMDRPMKPLSVPIFIGIIIFFTVVIFLGLLSVLGLNLTMTIPLLSSSGGLGWTFFGWIREQFTFTTFALAIALLAVVIYFRGRK
jgi:hypothetical protein